MVDTPRCAGPQSSETPANSETRGKRLERLAELSQEALAKHSDHTMAHQYCKSN
jgi:hypothetical protein